MSRSRSGRPMRSRPTARCQVARCQAVTCRRCRTSARRLFRWCLCRHRCRARCRARRASGPNRRLRCCGFGRQRSKRRDDIPPAACSPGRRVVDWKSYFTCGASIMKDVQRIAIVDPSDATREPLRNLLLGVESVWLEAECSRYEFFIDVARQSSPDIVVVTLDAEHNKALQLIQQLSVEFPNMPILAVSARGDGQSILQALRAGAKEFLTAPVVLEELLLALQRLRTNRGNSNGDLGNVNNGTARTESLVVAIVGSKG